MKNATVISFAKALCLSALFTAGAVTSEALTLDWAVGDGIWDDTTPENWKLGGTTATDVPQTGDIAIVAPAMAATVEFASTLLDVESPLLKLEIGNGTDPATLLVANPSCMLVVSNSAGPLVNILDKACLRLDNGATMRILHNNWHDALFLRNGATLSITNATLKLSHNGHYYIGRGGVEPAVVRIGQGGKLDAGYINGTAGICYTFGNTDVLLGEGGEMQAADSFLIGNGGGQHIWRNEGGTMRTFRGGVLSWFGGQSGGVTEFTQTAGLSKFDGNVCVGATGVFNLDGGKLTLGHLFVLGTIYFNKGATNDIAYEINVGRTGDNVGGIPAVLKVNSYSMCRGVNVGCPDNGGLTPVMMGTLEICEDSVFNASANNGTGWLIGQDSGEGYGIVKLSGATNIIKFQDVKIRKTGVIRGWGILPSNGGGIFHNEGRLIADGEGVARDLKIRRAPLTSVVDVPAAVGWGGNYAVNQGRLTLFIKYSANPDGTGSDWNYAACCRPVVWGDGASTYVPGEPRMVNSVGILGVPNPGNGAGARCTVSLLAVDRPDIPAGLVMPLAVWDVRKDVSDPNYGGQFDSLQLTFRYDDSLAQEMRAKEDELRLYRWDEAKSTWKWMKEVTPDTVNKWLATPVMASDFFTYYAVTKLASPQTMILIR